MTKLTYRSSRSGTLQAAYCGEARVGYIESRAHGRWLWQLSVALGPAPKFGRDGCEADAKVELERAFDHWLALAGLITKEKMKMQDKFKLLREAAKTSKEDPADALLAEIALDVLESALADLHRIADALEQRSNDAAKLEKYQQLFGPLQG